MVEAVEGGANDCSSSIENDVARVPFPEPTGRVRVRVRVADEDEGVVGLLLVAVLLFTFKPILEDLVKEEELEVEEL